MRPPPENGPAPGVPRARGVALRRRPANRTVAAELRTSGNTVGKWRERFRLQRLSGLSDEPRSGAPRKATDDRIVEVITRTLEAPPTPVTHWTTRHMAVTGVVESDDRPDLADVRPAVASRGHVQVVAERRDEHRVLPVLIRDRAERTVVVALSECVPKCVVQRRSSTSIRVRAQRGGARRREKVLGRCRGARPKGAEVEGLDSTCNGADRG